MKVLQFRNLSISEKESIVLRREKQALRGRKHSFTRRKGMLYTKVRDKKKEQYLAPTLIPIIYYVMKTMQRYGF